MAPIEFYTFDTPNGRKISILLEELNIPYRKHVIDIERGEQNSREFLALSPNGKIPVIVDPMSGDVVFESCVILLYLADRFGRLGPSTEDERLKMQQWLFFQASQVGPMIGQLWHFLRFCDQDVPVAIERYRKESNRLFGVLERRLSNQDHVVGNFSIVDIALWPWIDAGVEKLDLSLASFPNLARWHLTISQRPSI